MVRLERTVHPRTLSATDAGRVEFGKPIDRIMLMLSPSADKAAALKQFLEQQQNPTSADYHHWLSAAEFGARFGAGEADIQSVRSWLEANGFTIGAAAKGGRWIEFAGTSGQVEATFRTELHYFRIAGRQYLANAGDISLPQSIAQISLGLVSLNNFPKRPPTHNLRGFAGVNAQGQKVKLAPSLTAVGTSTTTEYTAPGDFAAIYNTKPLLAGGTDGSGIAIAVTGQSQIELTDVQQFRNIFGLKLNDPNIILSGPDPGIANPVDAEESTLDVEWAGAIAPGATIDLVIAGSTDSTNGVDLAAAYAVDNQIAPILTYTYGSCEQSLQASGNAFYNALWQQAAAEGITVVVATGDNGAAACDAAGFAATQGMAVNGAASTPFNVAVGGTQFNDTGATATYWRATNAPDYSSAIGYIPEVAWNEACDPAQPTGATNCFFSNANFSSLAGGGGTSTIYAKPSWQTGVGVPADGFRDIPDVALAATSGHDDLVYCNSLGGTPCEINSQNQVVGLSLVGGTSVSTPAMAGILALVEQKNGAYQGQVNYTLYKLAQTSGASCNSSTETNPTAQNSCIFYDVMTGSNAVPCAGGSQDCSSTQNNVDGFLHGHPAGAGYDLATGLGSVNATNLANNWNKVTFQASQIQLQAPTTAFAHGTTISVSGTVAAASGSGTPTGAVSLKTNNFGDADTLSISNGAFASATVNDLPGGQYNLFAHYSGDGTFAPSDSNSIAVTVTPENSTTMLTTPGLPGGTTPYGNSIQLLAAVRGLSLAGNATGTITLKDGATVIGTYPLAADGTAFISTGAGAAYSFPVGTHSLQATYSGDNSFNASSSSALSFNIGQSSPTVIVGVNTNAISTTQAVIAHVNVVGFGTALATGPVQFTVDGAAFGASTLLQSGGLFGTSAQASTLISGMAAGTHVIGVNYDGNADPNYFSVNNADAVNEPIKPSVVVSSAPGTATSTTLSATTLPVTLGDTANFQVTVSPSTVSGSVTLWDAVAARTSATTITNGTATIQVPWTQGGSFALYAVYAGDNTHAPSSSTPVLFIVKQGTPQVALSAPTQVTVNQQVSLNGRVTGNPANPLLPYPTGVVEFWDSLNGGAMQLLATQNLTVGAGHIAVYGLRTKLAVGTHVIKLHYGGDNNWKAGDSASVTITSGLAPDFALGVSPNPVVFTTGSTGTATVTVTPSGGFTGNVTLSCPTGSAFPVVGYACGFTPSAIVDITGASAGTATLSLTPTVTFTGAVFPTSTTTQYAKLWRFPLVAGMLLLSVVVIGWSGSQTSRQFAFVAGCVLCVGSLVMGCGGGGGGVGGGGGKVPSTTTLTTSNARAAYQTTVTLNVRVNANSTPGGSVQLVDNGQIYSSGIVTAGVATFQTTTLPVGIHVITAQYSGDSNTQSSISGPVTQIIVGNVPSFTITGTADNGSHTTAFTVTVN